MENSTKPQAKLAKQVLPKPLLDCIIHIFGQHIEDTALVGGTALSGYYAGHRRSDDIDLFSKNDSAFRAAVLAVRSLERIGVAFSNETHSAQYFHALCLYRKHSFTIDVVLDDNLFRVGSFATVKENILVPTLQTLLRMKIATLVSRTSEKDLYDVHWLFLHFSHPNTQEWIALGQSIDKGVNGENLLASIAGTTLRKEACDFSLDSKISRESIYKLLVQFRKTLIIEIHAYLKGLPTPPLGKLVKALK